MKNRFYSRFGVYAIITAGLCAPIASVAQTPVSTSVHMSGSCFNCDLSDRDLSRLTMRGSNFSHSDFNHSNLSGSKIYQTNLSETNFNKAFLMKVVGVEVNFAKADLQDATLTEASLASSTFFKANLKRADLTRGTFSQSDFSRANLKSADAPNANFTGARFVGAILKHTNFINANFTNADLTNAKFGDADLSGAIFSGANLSGADLSEVKTLSQGQISGSCGDQKTELPEPHVIPYCKDPNQLTPESKQDGRSNTGQKKYYAVRAPRGQTIVMDQNEFEAFMADIEKTMNELPSNSKERNRWSKRRSMMLQEQPASSMRSKPGSVSSSPSPRPTPPPPPAQLSQKDLSDKR